MKKLIIVVFFSLILSACVVKKSVSTETPQDRYLAMASLLSSQEILKEKPSNFSLSTEMIRADQSYRYYVILDEPKEAMYNVRVLAMEEGSDYGENMAASAGIFEEKRYHLVPNQYNVEEGYVKGISVSGLSDKQEIHLRIFVRWENVDSTEVYRDFYRVSVKVGSKQ